MSAPPPAPLTPLVWCRRVLAALGHRQAHGRSTSELEMLLSYFVERDPSPEAFAHLLGQYVTSSRPGVAEAAAVLDRAWQRSAAATPTTPPPSREETLRTLGARLDELRAQAAYLVLAADSAQLQAFGQSDVQRWGTIELWQEVAARTALRGQGSADATTEPPRFEPLLRLVGVELDSQPPQSYQLLVTAQTVVVEGSAGYYRLCTAEGLASQARTAPTRRGARPPPASDS